MQSNGIKNMVELGFDTTQCPYCRTKINNKTKTKEHIIPQSRNGSNHYKNLLWVCGTCNNIVKHDRLFGGKKLSDKTVKDKEDKIYIDTVEDRINYISGIRSVIQKILKDDEPIN